MKHLNLFVCLFFCSFLINAKTVVDHSAAGLSGKTSSRSDSIDIVHYDIALSIQNLSSKTISGTTTLTIDPKDVDSLTTIKLDLLKLTVTDVKVNTTAAAFFQNDSELYVIINRKNNSSSDSLLNVAIIYSGQPVSDPQWGGFYFSGNYAYNMGVAFKSVPHNFGRCWFPCIDNFTNRATYSFHITTDPTFKAVCNGLQLPETENGDGSTTWNWKLNQPIPTYLASVAVGKYEFIKYEFQGQTRTYPVWLAVVATDTAKARQSFDKLNSALSCFESKYGPYPFERVGYVGVPFNAGAMEHATNIAYPNYAIDGGTNYETLFAHELSHMWWGDLATCRTAEDMWLNEGWASFNEALFLECVYGKEAYLNDIKDKSSEVLLSAPKSDGGWYPVSGIPQNITYGTHVYKKGALMVHTLRSLMGDSAFFAACKSYLNRYTFADVSSEELKNEFQQFTTVNLSNFFQKWIYSPGHSDIVISNYRNFAIDGVPGTAYHFEFSELQRKHKLVSDSLPFTFTMYFSYPADTLNRNLTLINGKASFDTVLVGAQGFEDWRINEDSKIQLGSTTQTYEAITTGAATLSNALFSLNVQNRGTNKTKVYVKHHWVGPIDRTQFAYGVRISPERYWSVAFHKYSSTFKAFGYFNYDGTSGNYLDNELITKTEDSLVLLYRAFPDHEWQIHTDNTFQPGNSKTDKVGRFWVNNLKNGEYAFGMRDASVVGLQEVKNTTKTIDSFRIIPNPSGEELVLLQFTKPTPIRSIEVVDSKGSVISNMDVNRTVSQQELSVNKLVAGNYFIIVKTPETTIRQQFIRK